MTWPSSFSAGTLGYMRDRISDELGGRDDLSTQISACIATAIGVYQSSRFKFSESRDVCQFNTAAGQEFYTSSDNAAIATLFMFDYVTATIGNIQTEVHRKFPKDIELATQNGTMRGQPLIFAYYNEKMRFYPTPDKVYPIIVAGHMNIAAPASDSATGNRWMVDAEQLIRCRAKYELSLHYGVDFPDLAQRMHPDTGATGDAYSNLKSASNKIVATGKVRPTAF